jgi:hypothetical protein
MGRDFPRRSMIKVLSATRLSIWLRTVKKRLDKRTLKREGLLKSISPRLITSLIIFLEINLFIVVFKVNLINNSEQ